MTPQELRTRRTRLGLSQAELARELDVHVNSLARWERGELVIERPGMLALALDQLEQRANPVTGYEVLTVVTVPALPYLIRTAIGAPLFGARGDMLSRACADAAAYATANNARTWVLEMRWNGEQQIVWASSDEPWEDCDEPLPGHHWWTQPVHQIDGWHVAGWDTFANWGRTSAATLYGPYPDKPAATAAATALRDPRSITASSR